jgi:hypothetical protein
MLIFRRVEDVLSRRDGMLLDRDIWRAANLLISEYGDGAEFVAACRADEMLDRRLRPWESELGWSPNPSPRGRDQRRNKCR